MNSYPLPLQFVDHAENPIHCQHKEQRHKNLDHFCVPDPLTITEPLPMRQYPGSRLS